MERYFVLNDRGEPMPELDVDVWARWFEAADRSVARTVVSPQVVILTVFRGFDEPTEGKAPLLFESRVFGGVLDGEEVLYATRANALEGHEHLAAWCRMGNMPDGGITEDQII